MNDHTIDFVAIWATVYIADTSSSVSERKFCFHPYQSLCLHHVRCSQFPLSKLNLYYVLSYQCYWYSLDCWKISGIAAGHEDYLLSEQSNGYERITITHNDRAWKCAKLWSIGVLLDPHSLLQPLGTGVWDIKIESQFGEMCTSGFLLVWLSLVGGSKSARPTS